MSKSAKRLRKFIPVEEAIARWRRDPAYMAEYEALDEEFAVVEQLAATEGAPPAPLTPEEKQAIAKSKAAAARGEFATDDEVRAVRAKHGR